ncbi:MAG: CpaF family protein [Gordonibacter sp.]|nr:CpaF family protein [Gordonibacter sp.]
MAATDARGLAAEVKARVQEELSVEVADLGYLPDEDELEGMIGAIYGKIADVLPLESEDAADLRRSLVDDFLHYGPLHPYLSDPAVTEVCANGPRNIFVEVDGKMRRAETTGFDDEDHLMRIVNQIGQQVNRRCDEAAPIMDARLPDGSRVNAVSTSVSIDGTALTIRKFPAEQLTVEDYVRWGSASPAMMAFLGAAVAGRCSIVVAGGTGAGKTTLLNILSHAIPEDERIITIEDAAELQLSHEDLVRMESRPANIEGAGRITIHDLLRTALRMRPDRIIVGECRDAEALEIINAMTTGHDGSLTTVHANDVLTTFSRLEDMVRRCGIGYDSTTIKRMISQAVNLVVVVRRYVDGSRKIASITALTGGMEGDVIAKEELFRFEPASFDTSGRQLGEFCGCGVPMDGIIDRINSWGQAVDDDWFFDRHDPERGCSA